MSAGGGDVGGAAGPEPAATGEALLWTTPADSALPAETVDALQEALDAYRQAQEAPGLTAAVVTPDGMWAGASGVDGTGTPLQPESAFAIASITKTFVAAEVVLLSAQEQVDLDADIADYVDLPFTSDGATVREVLGMESGFPLDPVDEVLGMTGDLDREWTQDDVFDLVLAGSIQGVRGEDPSYNNLNYWVLGALVEEVTGEPLAVALRQDVLDPFGLERVWVQAAEEPTPPLAIAADEARFPEVDEDGPFLPSRAVASAAGAAGGMAADAPTLARWGHLLYGGAVLERSLVEDMTTPEGDDDWYGLGTVLARDGEAPLVGHDGDLGVYHSLLAVWPDDAISVAVLVPTPSPLGLDEELTPTGLARTLHEAALG
ncbi:serine hydrolase domain-containing protein [Aquipuribacter nitratireducens]|uniref:Serine hydrolase domain-containing protein n=1 Tax=Aquipuribacter nitratireducens TaxID=650104 RepID=A0ABW0GLI0_9MICO